MPKKDWNNNVQVNTLSTPAIVLTSVKFCIHNLFQSRTRYSIMAIEINIWSIAQTADIFTAFTIWREGLFCLFSFLVLFVVVVSMSV